MSVRHSAAYSLAVAIGVSLTLSIIGLCLGYEPCSGLTLFGLTPVDVWQCSDVGPYRSFSGIWVDGFEENRFFPDATALRAAKVPDTDARLQIDEAARDLVVRAFPAPLRPVRYQTIAISFFGNELRPHGGIGPGRYIKRVYVVRRIESARLIKRLY